MMKLYFSACLRKRRGSWSLLAFFIFLSYMHLSTNTDVQAFTSESLTNRTSDIKTVTKAIQSTNDSDVIKHFTDSNDTSMGVTDVSITMTPSFSNLNDTSSIQTDTASTADEGINVTTTQTISLKGEYTDYAGKITLPVALLFGLFGNSITMATMTTRPFRAMTWSIILMSLAVADTFVLLAVPLNKPFVIDLIGVDVPAINRITCKTYHFIRRTSKMLSAWLIVLVCFERFIAVRFPMKVRQICTKTRTYIGVVCVLLMSAIYCAFWITTADVVNGKCLQTVITRETRSKAMLLLISGSVLIVVLPIAIMLVLTPITCFILYRHKLARTQLSTTNPQDDSYSKATAMLISICIGYVVLLTPAMVSYNVAFYRKESLVTTRYLPLIVIRELSQVMELINYSSNFFLYTAFNDIFRKRVMNCLTCNTRNLSTSMSQSHQISMVDQSQSPKVLKASGSICDDD